MSSYVLCGHNKCATRWLVSVIEASGGAQVVAGNQGRTYRRSFKEGQLAERAGEIRRLIRASERPVLLDLVNAIQDEKVLETLKSIDPDMRAIVIYREPVSVLLSTHNYQRWSYDTGYAVGRFDASQVCAVRDRDVFNSIRQGFLREQYEQLYRYDRNARTLRRYFGHFCEILFEDIVADRERTLEKIFRFLELPLPLSFPDIDRKNVGMAVKSRLADKLIGKCFTFVTGLNSRQLYDRYRDDLLTRSVFRTLLNLNYRDPDFLSRRQKTALRREFAPMVTDFVRITGLDVGAWGYDLKSTGS